MKEETITPLVEKVIRSRKLACLRCRQRRRKCDMESPCGNCQKLEVECVFTDQDLRRNRHSATYVKTLENQVAMLKSSLQKIKNSQNDHERSEVLDSIDLKDNSNYNASFGTAGSLTHSNASSTTKLDVRLTTPSNFNTNSSARAVTGNISKLEPNSIYPTNSLSIKKKSINKQIQDNKDSLKKLSRSPLILRSLSLFFKWLYPGHYMFIHRETFLSAFFGDENTKAYYCSEELVYAIAALGAKASPKDEELYAQSETYYHHAKQIVLRKIFQLVDRSLADATSSSKLAIIQTLLCLAFYDIENAENPMAWYLSGLAFRVAHEIGLHLNPEAWNHVYEDELSRMDYAVRSRIYWGCYIADHLISVLFGRSTSLRMSNSTVPETSELPDIETGIEDYIFKPGVPLSMANPLKKLIVLSRMSEIFATKIFIQTESLEQRSEYLIKFNMEMRNWRKTLPSDIRWSKESLRDMKDYDPTVMYVWFHYYIVLISYNKPFIHQLDLSKNLIERCVEELYLLLNVWEKNFHSFEICDLYMIYSAILVIQCMNGESMSKKYHKYFQRFLDSASVNYEVAKNFIEINNNLDHKNNDTNPEVTDLFGTLSHGIDFSLEYNFDFTLLNEIDKLISTNDPENADEISN